MKSNKLLMAIVIVIVISCLSPIVLAKPTETNSVKAIGKGTIKPENLEPIKLRMLLVAQVDPTPNSDGDFEGTADIIMRFVLPDGTKITAFRDIPFIVDFEDDILQGFKLKINDNELLITAIVVKNKVYGHLSTSIIAHELTHVVDCYLSFKMEPKSTDWINR